jgi:type VI secretion system protein ImpA
MNGTDGQTLVLPITAERPCGESLEDTPLLASFDTFRLFGESRAPEDLPEPPDPDDPKRPVDTRKPPEWAEIRSAALEALARSRDLRVLAHLATALLRTDGFPAFAAMVTVAAQWVDQYWTQVYPLIDEDAILRRNALNCFADPMAVVDRLRRMPLVSSREHGRFSLRDIDIATGQAPAGPKDVRHDPKLIDAAFAAMPAEELAKLHESAAGAVAALRRIDEKMRTEGGPDAAPSFENLTAQLVRIERVFRTQLAGRNGSAATDGTLADEAGAGGETAARGAVGAIRSRQDAIRALDAVAEFFRQTEPSSPVPMFLERAKRLVSKDFLAVLADIAPEALAQAKAAGGLRDE